MKSYFAIPLALLALGAAALAGGSGTPFDHSWDIAIIDRALASAKPGDRWVKFGDVGIKYADLQVYRDRLAGNTETPGPNVITPPGTTFKWPAGNVYYRFDPTQVGNGTITAIKMQLFRDGLADWAAFANLHFIENISGQPNYITVQESAPGNEGGFSSSVGMAGGEQFVQIGQHSWNRGTVCHEVGHALGLWHEQQRPDRDTYVMIHPENIDDLLEPNFAIISGGQTFATAYDFYSIMHYKRNDLSNNGQDTITMRPGYTQYIDLIGNVYDRILSKGERAGMAAVYGNPSPLPSAVVTNTNDSGPGSLRTAIYYAFDKSTDVPPVPTTITFHIPTSDPNYNAGTGVFSIKPTYFMTALGNGTTIDGTSEAAFLGTDTNPNGPEIALDGSNFAVLGGDPFNLFSPGLILRAANCTVKGLTIQNFNERGIDIHQGTDPNGSAATGNVIGGTTAAERNVISGNATYGIGIRDSTTTGNIIRGNFIGTNQTGNAAQANAVAGVVIYLGAHDNTIGGTVGGAGNVISGNMFHGVFIGDAGSNNNLVQGNFIGLNAAGNGAVPNGTGIEITAGAQSNTIGGTAAGARNTISGNDHDGIVIDDLGDVTAVGTRNNVIQGNLIGVNNAVGHVGDAAISNQGAGIDIFGGAQSNTIGGTAAGAGNLVSGNLYQGIAISGAGTNNMLVQGNVIGLNAAGNGKIQNREGVAIYGGAQSNTIGGTNPAARNIISGNQFSGVSIGTNNTNNNLVQGNYIGVDATGSTVQGNAGDGVAIYGDGPAPSPSPAPAPDTGAQSNTVGGLTDNARNIISGNGGNGVSIGNPGNNGTNNNVVQGNYIGTDAGGMTAKPNGGAGVVIFGGAQSNTIGGTTSSARNIISGNTFQGVGIGGLGGSLGATTGPNQNLVLGNYIGLKKDGSSPLGNGSVGVGLSGSAQSNTIGGSSPGAGNVIAANTFRDVDIFGTNTNANVVAGNLIGLDVTGTIAITNNNSGAAIAGGAKNNIIGGTSPGTRNFISGHAQYGLYIADAGTTGNLVQGNTIGLNVAGAARPNTNPAVAVFNGAQSNTVGGSAIGASNIIADNTNEGVALYDATTIRNAIGQNSIFGNHVRGIGLYTNSNINQAAPTLSSAVLGAAGNVGGTDVGGTLTGSAASTAFNIEFFANPPGNDEGQFFVGSASVMTNGSGTATFTSPIHLGAAVPRNYLITATATDPNGNTSQFSTTAAVSSVDSDSDGMPDNWENAHTLNPSNPADANIDSDGDGFTNLQEFNAGTDPRNSTSRFVISSIDRSAGNPRINFQALAGKTYRLEYRDDLINGSWGTLVDQILSPSTTSLQIVDPSAAALPKRFYRLAIEP